MRALAFCLSLLLALPAAAQTYSGGGGGGAAGGMSTNASNATLPTARNNLGFVNFISVTDPAYGAVCDGSTNDTAALNAAFAAAVAGGVVLLPEGKDCLVSTAGGVSITQGITVQSSGGHATNPAAGARIVCALTVTPCVTMGNFDSVSTVLRNVAVTRAAGAIPASSIGILVKGELNPLFDNVSSSRSDVCLKLLGDGTTGLGAKLYNFNTQACSDAHVVIDSWVETYFIGGRFGQSGTGDVTSNAYIKLRATSSQPNGLYVTGVQFNQGNSTKAAAWLDFLGITSSASEFNVTNSHVEAVSGGYIKSDATTTSINMLYLANVTFSDSTPSFFSLNAATQPAQWGLANIQASCADMTLAPTPVFTKVSIANSTIGCASSFTGASGSRLSLVGNNYAGNVTLAGAWSDLSMLGGGFASGSLTNSATGNVNVVLPSQTAILGGAGLTAGGVLTGTVLTANAGISGTGASTTQVGNAAGTSQIAAIGPDTSNNGLFNFNSYRSNASNGFVFLGSDASGNATFHANVAAPTLSVPSVPTSAGAGGLFLCIDNTGATYKKATCP